MKTADAITYAGGTPKDLADLLGITPSAITQWEGEVPPVRQLQLQRLSKGKLKADADCMERLTEKKQPRKPAKV